MSKSWKNGEGVSPVIGTILMVAITVVLAAVLYTMVSGWDREEWVDPIVFRVQKTGNNWSMLVTDAPSNLDLTGVAISVRDSNGATVGVMSSVALSELTSDHWALYKAYYQKSKSSDATVNAGDVILMDVARYPSGCSYIVVTGQSIRASGTF